MTRDEIVSRLGMDYAARREDDRARYEAREREARERCPGLGDILDARRATLMLGVRQNILKKDGVASDKPLSGVMDSYNRKVRAALKSGGLPVDYLQPVYQCSVCRDEGFVYDPSRRMCECMSREYVARVMQELGLKDDNQTFERFDESLFDDKEDENGSSQLKGAKVNRNTCERYADAYPDTETRDLLLMGESGLGKTYLLRAMQHRLAERGYLPLYVSAYRFFELSRQAYIENNSDRISELLTAPILMIDDLGTEPLMNNVTVAQLFNLLNERQTAKLHTIISTNLSMEKLRERYTERVTSRFLDRSQCKRLPFQGKDIRLQKGVKAK